jgi:hypothetical protein
VLRVGVTSVLKRAAGVGVAAAGAWLLASRTTVGDRPATLVAVAAVAGISSAWSP